MSKRQRHKQESEPEFGSDSFLDVISNMVGILIILILMAAFRAKRAPVTADELVAVNGPVSTAVANEVDVAESVSVVAVEESRAVEQNDEPAAPVVDQQDSNEELKAEAERVARINAELEADAQQLRSRAAQYERLVQRLEREVADAGDPEVKKQLKEARRRQQSAEQGLSELRASLLQQQQSQAAVRASLVDEQQEIATLKEKLDQLNEQLKLVAARERNKDKLRHKVTALGQTVYGQEICFRVARGRISQVPLEELSKLVGEKIKQNASWIVKSNRHQGEVGPIDGYVMKYEVIRASSGMMEDLNRSYGTVKLEVPRFTVEPIPGLYDEPVKEALRGDGLFVRALAHTPSETTVTIWVYPDSFNDYRQLAAFAQQHGFLVAGRPLPEGLPITGSSNGSRSVGQ